MKIVEAAFIHYAPKLWNLLPKSVRELTSFGHFLTITEILFLFNFTFNFIQFFILIAWFVYLAFLFFILIVSLCWIVKHFELQWLYERLYGWNKVIIMTTVEGTFLHCVCLWLI